MLGARMMMAAAGRSVASTPLELWTWGSNTFYGSGGQLGLGDTNPRSSPVQVGALTTWASISVGAYHMLATKSDGTLWAWGCGSYGFVSYGQHGLNDTTNRSSPTQVGALTDWSRVSAGNNHSLAIKTDGTLWAWGSNSNGRLGLNNTTDRSSPTQVGALTDWASVSAGNNHSLAIKTDGTLWAWGSGSNGYLGLSDTTARSSPTQVGALNTWSRVSAGRVHSLAVKTDGTLWSWGIGNFGGLGLGDTAHRSSPTQVGALTTWASVGEGDDHSLAIKSDGTLWAWGRNSFGQLGLGDTANRSSPTQVGALTTWASVSPGGYLHTLAIKTDGTLWAWGSGDSGRLGLGDTAHRSSPVQIGALTTWTAAAAGGKQSGAIKE